MPWSRIARLGGVVYLIGPHGVRVFSGSSQPLPLPAMQEAPRVPTVLPTLGTAQLPNFCQPNGYKSHLFVVFILIYLTV